MEQVLGLFHDMRDVDRVTAQLQRSGTPFNRVIIKADMGQEDELRPEIPLTKAVLAAAQRFEESNLTGGSARSSGPKGGGKEERSDGAAGAEEQPSAGPVLSLPGDFHQSLAEKGLAGHQLDNLLKHIFSGHLLVVFAFEEVGQARKAVPLLTRMGALRTEYVQGSPSLKTGQSGGKT